MALGSLFRYDSKMLFKIRYLSPVILLPLVLSGCFLRPNTIVERFNGEFLCPKDQIKVTQPDQSQKTFYRAEGCNRRAHYRCSGDYGEFCERIGNPETIRPEAGALPGETQAPAVEPPTQSP
jgi:hypothetical protein